jgi:hypothetical protein
MKRHQSQQPRAAGAISPLVEDRVRTAALRKQLRPDALR